MQMHFKVLFYQLITRVIYVRIWRNIVHKITRT
jgi:hypothetical protein